MHEAISSPRTRTEPCRGCVQKRLRSTSKPSGRGGTFWRRFAARFGTRQISACRRRHVRRQGQPGSSRLGSHADTAALASLTLQVRAAQRGAARSAPAALLVGTLHQGAGRAAPRCTGTVGHRAASKRSPACGARRQRPTGGAAACACAGNLRCCRGGTAGRECGTSWLAARGWPPHQSGAIGRVPRPRAAVLNTCPARAAAALVTHTRAYEQRGTRAPLPRWAIAVPSADVSREIRTKSGSVTGCAALEQRGAGVVCGGVLCVGGVG